MRYPLRATALALTLAIVAAVPAAQAQGSSQLSLFVERELPRFVPEADVSTLSSHQIAALYLILTSDRSAIATRGEARSVIYGLGNLLTGTGVRRFP